MLALSHSPRTPPLRLLRFPHACSRGFSTRPRRCSAYTAWCSRARTWACGSGPARRRARCAHSSPLSIPSRGLGVAVAADGMLCQTHVHVCGSALPGGAGQCARVRVRYGHGHGHEHEHARDAKGGRPETRARGDRPVCSRTQGRALNRSHARSTRSM